jgi:RHS repeat-associated protein
MLPFFISNKLKKLSDLISIFFITQGAYLQSPNIPTDKLYTGQRLDGTGLYYYNARYYDPTIGRFISPDNTIPDVNNPQAFNRYSYVVNNPIKYVDPSGLDYVVLGGNSSTDTDRAFYAGWLCANLNVAPGEKVEFIPDEPSHGGAWDIKGLDVEPRINALEARLNKGDLTDIKLIGFSEGGCTVGRAGYEMAAGESGINRDVQQEIEAIIMLDAPIGRGPLIRNFESDRLKNLPSNLKEAGFDIVCLDIYNSSSPSHMSSAIKGWGNTYVINEPSKMPLWGPGLWISQAISFDNLHKAVFDDQSVSDYINGKLSN